MPSPDPTTDSSTTAEHEFIGSMHGGDGSAAAQLLRDPNLPADWREVPADGPHYRTEVCGVQLDPEQPRDAAQVRWGSTNLLTYLESEVHLFEPGIGAELASAVDRALDCPGYGINAAGEELPFGEGEINVQVQRLDGAPAPWIAWTETTQESGMIRHLAIAPVEDGWHWLSVVDLAGDDHRQVLLDALPASISGEG